MTKLDEMRACVATRRVSRTSDYRAGKHTGANETLQLALAAIDEARAEERARCVGALRALSNSMRAGPNQVGVALSIAALGGDDVTPERKAELRRHAEVCDPNDCGLPTCGAVLECLDALDAAEQRAAEGAGDAALLKAWGDAMAGERENRSHPDERSTYERARDRALALARGGRPKSEPASTHCGGEYGCGREWKDCICDSSI